LLLTLFVGPVLVVSGTYPSVPPAVAQSMERSATRVAPASVLTFCMAVALGNV
jgi:hypothetical protein